MAIIVRPLNLSIVDEISNWLTLITLILSVGVANLRLATLLPVQVIRVNNAART